MQKLEIIEWCSVEEDERHWSQQRASWNSILKCDIIWQSVFIFYGLVPILQIRRKPILGLSRFPIPIYFKVISMMSKTADKSSKVRFVTSPLNFFIETQGMCYTPMPLRNVVDQWLTSCSPDKHICAGQFMMSTWRMRPTLTWVSGHPQVIPIATWGLENGGCWRTPEVQ